MIKKLVLCLVLLLSISRFAEAGPLSNLNEQSMYSIGHTAPIQIDNCESHPVAGTKQPVPRTGTENWEQPQGSFFVIPAIIVAITALALFFNRN